MDLPKLAPIRQKSLFIDNQWQAPKQEDAFIQVYNPATGMAIQRLAVGDLADVAIATAAAKKAFIGWKKTTPTERADYLTKIANALAARRDELVSLSTLNNGKPLFEAEIDLDDAIACYRYYADLIITQPLQQPVALKAQSHRADCHLEPVGVVGLIVPWNFPLVTTAWKLAPALAAGCTAVLKPSEITPLPELVMGDIAESIGLPKGVLNIVVGGAAVGQAMVSHPDIAKISFTGSNNVGEQVMCEAAKSTKNISLELGGKSPIIVCDDVDIDEAVDYIIGGIFYNAGQMCSATSRLLVEESIAEKLLAKLKTATEAIVVGDGFAEATMMGAITHKKQYQKIQQDIAQGISDKLSLLTGGQAIDSSGYFIQPTIFTHVPDKHPLWREEIFGPVLCVRTFKNDNDAIEQANDSDYGLAATVVCQNNQRAEKLAAALNAGHIWINTQQVVFAETAWGGYGKSGIGRELGPWGLSAYQEIKHIVGASPKKS